MGKSKTKPNLKSKTPKALTIQRDGNKFTFSWTNGETYRDVDLLIKINGKPSKGIPYKAGAKDLKSNKVTITTPYKYTYTNKKKKKTTKTFTPGTSVSFTVRGMRKSALSKAEKKKYEKLVESDYAKWAVFKIERPKDPVVTVSWDGADAQNASTFHVNVADADKANRHWFWNYRYRTDTQYEGGKYNTGDWVDAGSMVASKDHRYQESYRSDKAFLRKFWAYSIGQRGVSPKGMKGGDPPNSAEHIYSKPLDPINVKVESASEKADGINICVSWRHNASYWHPIDKSECQYAISNPASGMNAPKNLDGTVITTHTHTDWNWSNGWTDGDAHEIDRRLEVNQCLFVRVKFVHDAEENYSPWVRASQLTSVLSNPEGFALDAQPTGNVLRVEATNTAESDVDDSFLVIYYKASQGDGKFTDARIIGVMPHGGYDYINVRLPSDPENPPEIEKLGVEAIAYNINNEYKQVSVTADTYGVLKEDLYYKLGNEYVKVTDEAYDSTRTYFAHFNITVGTVGAYQYKYYSLPTLNNTNSMRSDQLWKDGDFPKPPTNLEVVSSSTDTAKATWAWSWSAATHIELSWSASSDAWESTEEPSSYRVPVQRATSWNIKGLNSGEVWYIRARFIRVNPDGTETIGPWSVMKPLNLTAPPAKPELEFSKNKATENQDIIASWTYSSSDGTAQALAEIYLFTSDFYGDRVGYYRPAIEKLPIDPETGLPIFNADLVYYTFNDVYTKVTNPVEEDLDEYYIFDDSTPILKTDLNSSAQQITFTPHDLHLELGSSYFFCLRLTSQSSATSEYSNPVQLEVVEPLDPPVISTSAQFVPETVNDIVFGDTYVHTVDEDIIADKSYYTITGTVDDTPSSDEMGLYYEKIDDIYVKSQDQSPVEGKTYYFIDADRVIEPVKADIGTYYERDYTVVTRTYLALKSLPMTLNVTGAGENGTTVVSIERFGDYFTDKPDESIDRGYDGEIVALIRNRGESPITINRDDLLGYLDDGANYKL